MGVGNRSAQREPRKTQRFVYNMRIESLLISVGVLPANFCIRYPSTRHVLLGYEVEYILREFNECQTV
jgi:hypothetical protein